MKTKMKNTIKIVLAMTLALLMTVGAFATETESKTAEVKSKTVEVKGYTEDVPADGLDKVKSNFSITNVIDTFKSEKITTTLNHGFVVDGSTTITSLDSAAIFEAYKLTDKDKFEYDSEKPLPTSGKADIYIYDSKTGKSNKKTVEVSELGNYEIDFPSYQSGCTIEITEPGDYYVRFRYEAIAGAAEAVITVKASDTEKKEEKETTEEKPVVETLTATPTASKVLVNSKETAFDAYNIKGNNYFKIRDLANVVSGSEKQFDVTWDADKKVINLVSKKAYTVVGGEMAKGDGQEKTSTTNTSPIYKDGEKIELTAYTIGGNNYFKLRDIAKVFNIGVTWDNETKTVGIDTSKGYVEQ
ncbi:stalk domain-containing protein [Clostridiaceae bacterium M8S5]|nr:stalk domain-containing protein [Clostridiaceae bacterium M8S5]